MKIVFIKDVPRVGQRGQLKDVADGYGNSLLAKGLADRATSSVLSMLETKRKTEEYKKEMSKENFKLFLEKINTEEIIIKVRANEKGHLFKTVSREEVLKELFTKTGIELNEAFIDIGHIKTIGEHTIKFNDKQNTGECKIRVDSI